MTISFLLLYEADPFIQNYEKQNALDLACNLGSKNVETLIKACIKVKNMANFLN